jgi:hypothetical protein
LIPPEVTDPEVLVLAGIAATLEPDHAPGSDDPWEGSPFKWIKSQPSTTKGKIGEQLVAGWCAAKGFDVVRSGDREADRVIEGHRVEVKLSTLWKAGVYKFQQIRDQNYDFCFCLGICPFDAHAWLLPKAVLVQHVIGHMGQHTGAAATDTAWLSFPVNRPLPWMTPYGRRLSDIRVLIEALGRGPHG